VGARGPARVPPSQVPHTVPRGPEDMRGTQLGVKVCDARERHPGARLRLELPAGGPDAGQVGCGRGVHPPVAATSDAVDGSFGAQVAPVDTYEIA
jgi:hypothetical protein